LTEPPPEVPAPPVEDEVPAPPVTEAPPLPDVVLAAVAAVEVGLGLAFGLVAAGAVVVEAAVLAWVELVGAALGACVVLVEAVWVEPPQAVNNAPSTMRKPQRHPRVWEVKRSFTSAA
jgi:hypothetical protein